MRMRPHIHALARYELHRAEMIEEDEGTYHLPLAMRQRAAHGKAVAEVARARHDDEIERVTGFGVAEHGIVGGKPAHFGTPLFCCSYHTPTVVPAKRSASRGP